MTDHDDWSWPEDLHRKFESDPPHDRNPERRYSPEAQARMQQQIAYQRTLLTLWGWMTSERRHTP